MHEVGQPTSAVRYEVQSQLMAFMSRSAERHTVAIFVFVFSHPCAHTL